MPNEPINPPQSNAVNPVARHNARRYALQAMYQWQVAHTPVHELENEFLVYHINKKLDLDYFKELLHGVPAHAHEIDQAITPFLSRSLKDIDPVELAVLRISTYEIIKRTDIPYRIIINEALELCKKFGSVDGYKFVNGVMDKVARKHRELEMKIK